MRNGTYGEQRGELHIALNKPDTHGEAAQILGGLIGEVRLTPEENGAIKAELFGDLAAMLAYAQHEKKSPDSEKPGRELSLVAGGGHYVRRACASPPGSRSCLSLQVMGRGQRQGNSHGLI